MRKALTSKKPLRGVSDPRHGTPSGYAYWGCRCGKCRGAASQRIREARERGVVTNHGRYGYDMGCRCEICKAGKTEQMVDRQAKKREWKESHSQGSSGRVNLSVLA